MIDIQEWLIRSYEEGEISKTELRAALAQRDSFEDFCAKLLESEDFVCQIQDEIEEFLEMMDDIE
jgi:hypothetical protein